ncbi:MAG: hypothetical protein KGL39_53135 [Patescibacteria group bacterium]|nr:hypothetical protein [Patescibacteria group bacterium]
MTRKQLEKAALKNVCACWYYDLYNQMDETDDLTLERIIDDSQYLHKQNQKDDPVPQAEYEEEMRGCPDTK